MKKTWSLAILAAAFPFTVALAAPSGFDAPAGHGAPQGFTAEKMTVSQIRSQAKDDQIVSLDGAFTKQVGKNKFIFTDKNGETVVVKLDKKRDWSQIVKDLPMELVAEVDKDWKEFELKALDAKPKKDIVVK